MFVVYVYQLHLLAMFGWLIQEGGLHAMSVATDPCAARTKLTPPRGAKSARARIVGSGTTIAAWATANGFGYTTVIDVLRGHRKGVHGEGFRVAVALGLKKAAKVNYRTGAVRNQESTN